MEKVAILTNFREFVPGYSLTGIVYDQFKLLTRKGHPVDVFVCEDYHGRATPPEIAEIPLKKLMPRAKLTDYRSRKDISPEHQNVVSKTAEVLKENLGEYRFILTHDLIFTGWNLPYGQGIREATEFLPDQRWMHWIHSIPSGYRDFWYLREFGNSHRLVYPNRTDIRRVIEQFRDDIERIRVIPHPKDLRSWMEFCPETCAFIDDYPGMLSADIVQVYPASADRLEAKRVYDLILVFAQLKKKKFSVCLVIPNQWATKRQARENLTRYTKVAHRNGLTSEEVVFTSNWRHPRYEQGLPKRVVREMMMCSNLFIFPTREETFGLVLPEACLSSAVLPVCNKSLGMMMEITGHAADYIDFGSFNNPMPDERPERWHEMIAQAVIARMLRNESIMTRTIMRQKYNWDNLYDKYYGPIFAESANWT